MVLLVCKYKGLGEWVVVVVKKVNIFGGGGDIHSVRCKWCENL